MGIGISSTIRKLGNQETIISAIGPATTLAHPRSIQEAAIPTASLPPGNDCSAVIWGSGGNCRRGWLPVQALYLPICTCKMYASGLDSLLRVHLLSRTSVTSGALASRSEKFHFDLSRLCMQESTIKEGWKRC